MDYLQYFKKIKVSSLSKIVLNLIINGLPSILKVGDVRTYFEYNVLNLIINGLPSIP